MNSSICMSLVSVTWRPPWEDMMVDIGSVDPNFGPLPFYPLVLPLKGSGGDVNLFKERSQGEALPGMPAYDPNKIVHGEQSIQVFKPLPANGGDFSLEKTCSGVYDKGSGMVIETTMDLVGNDGTKYCTMVSKSFVRGYGGWGVSIACCMMDDHS